jgi:16S rRNA (adenine1518-N6/adenine1519-N6)-dimethyltransferase
MPIDFSPLQARTLLKHFDLKPRKSLGQNFLVSAGAREIIIEAADLQPGEVVLEIGPGLGALTERLVDEAGWVVSVELDDTLYEILNTIFDKRDNLKLISGDILEIQPGELGLEPGYVVVANIPYNITSNLLRQLMESDSPASRIILTIQKEVAERIVAGPGDMSLLSLSVQLFGVPTIKANLSSGSFYPAPSVESSVVRIDMHEQPLATAQEIDTLFRLARAGFGQKRKQLQNALAHGLPISKAQAENLLRSCDIDPRARAQALCLKEWLCLAEKIRHVSAG